MLILRVHQDTKLVQETVTVISVQIALDASIAIEMVALVVCVSKYELNN